MVMQLLVINTSSSIYFTRIGLFPHLFKYFKIITTEEIKKEIIEGSELGYKNGNILLNYINEGKLEIKKTIFTKEICNDFHIKEEDASVLSLAKETNAFLATEDRQIEKIALFNQVKIINTATAIYYLYQKKDFSEQQSLLLLDLLQRNGYNRQICFIIKEKIIKGD